MWKSLSVEDQEQRSAVCLWVCVCVWLLQHLWANKEQDVDYPRTTSVWCCWSPHSTVHYWHKHAYSGWKLHRKLTTTYIFEAVERVLIQHIFRTLLCPVLLEMHTHTSLSMLYFFFILEHWVDFLSDVHWLRHARPTYWQLLVTLNFIHFLSFSPSRTPDLQEFYLQLSFHL